MSYQVLARKWRPANFSEIVGQEHVLRAMINALDNQRLHHAYLFTGTRGVGKTTLARILAKSLNCEKGISSQPCGECPACVEVAEGRFIDLIEVDAASRTKVDDTRELLDNVQYAPNSGRFKVYLIDEVHMLSTHSFNALLKTLEEPPPHVKFLLATTDPQKLPVTVLSRCLQFNLKRVPEDLIAQHLERILTAEAVEFEKPALRHIAHAAEGSLRDALSLLDQGIAFGNGFVGEADIGEMLGSISRTHLQTLLLAVSNGDAAAVMAQVDVMASLSPDYDAVLAAMITILHDLALAQHIPESLETHGLDVQGMSEIAVQMSAEDIQLFYEIALRARRDVSLVPDPRHALEMALLRMLAFKPADSVDMNSNAGSKKKPEQALPPVNQAKADPVSHPSKSGNETVAPVVPKPSPLSPQALEPDIPDSEFVPVEHKEEPESVNTSSADEGDWESLITKMGLSGMAKAFASHCLLCEQTETKVVLQLAERHESLKNDSVTTKIESALCDYFSRDIKLSIQLSSEKLSSPAEKQRQANEKRQFEAEQSIVSDPVVQDIQKQFDADIIPGSIRPKD